MTRLRLYQFRNYTQAQIGFDASLNLIIGANAQGKTNLLEAIATLTLTRSPRTTTAADLFAWGADGCAVDADVARPAGPCTLGLRLARSSSASRVTHTTTVDGKPRPAKSILGVCPVVMFWPDDLQLVKAGPDGRRRMLDVLLAQLDPRAAAHLLRYRHVLEQRNALLHRLRAEGADAAPLAGFTEELVHHGAHVVVARQRLLRELAPLASAALHELSEGGDVLELRYAASHGAVSDDVDESARVLRRALDARREEERARGVTVLGPHRDDIDIVLDGRPARSSGSQGQQRSIVLACKLAEMRHLTRCAGMTPVVMLDDVLSELDRRRRSDLLALLARDAGQVLVTTTEALPDVDAFSSMRTFSVTSGTVTPT
ncbi:MAG: DNA replication/repair protein RecF [Candidatus Dormibacteria bacterium]